ncbi:MAG: hypothetical protein CSA74_08500 [Rhodobacterales bacterium]|nr:MAG: hypothetical protein CSA74_08500 [Rhodobacterales bacterium]
MDRETDMILYFVLIGFVTGAVSATAVLTSGGSIPFALLAYSLGGAAGVMLLAVFVAFVPPMPRPRRGLPATGSQHVHIPVQAPHRR